MRRTVADEIVARLRASGARRVFGVPGNRFTAALSCDPCVAWAHVSSEQSAALAASGEAAVTGRLAVATGGCGPGNMGLIECLMDAQRIRLPILAIVVGAPLTEASHSRSGESSAPELRCAAGVFWEQARAPEEVAGLLRFAMRTTTTRQGVAALAVPAHLFHAEPTSAAPMRVRQAVSRVTPDIESLRHATRQLDSADHFTILLGAGFAGAHDEVIALAEALKAPVVHTLRGKDHIAYDNPSDAGLAGLFGSSSGYRAMENCDTLQMLGTDLPYRQFYPDPRVPIVQVDVHRQQIGHRIPVDALLTRTVRDTAAALVPLLRRHRDNVFARRLIGHYEAVRAGLDRSVERCPAAGSTHSQDLAMSVDRLAASDAAFTADIGAPALWAARNLTMNGQRRLIGSFHHGAKPNALSHAIGIQAAQPARQVIALCKGSGSTSLLGDLASLRQLDLPVKIVVFDDEALAADGPCPGRVDAPKQGRGPVGLRGRGPIVRTPQRRRRSYGRARPGRTARVRPRRSSADYGPHPSARGHAKHADDLRTHDEGGSVRHPRRSVRTRGRTGRTRENKPPRTRAVVRGARHHAPST